MRILLNNFRSCVGCEYTFECGKLTLITGKSGAGKSTIFEGIYWCLYGSMRGIYNLESPKDKCYVILIDEDYIIYRQGHPNLLRVIPLNLNILQQILISPNYSQFIVKILPKLKLNYTQSIEFSDNDPGQVIINNRYGSKSLWKASSYITQGMRCDLLTKSNAERMILLNMLSFASEDPSKYLSIIEENLCNINHQLHDLQVEHRTENSLLNSDLIRKPILPEWVMTQEQIIIKEKEKDDKERLMIELQKLFANEQKRLGNINSLNKTIESYNTSILQAIQQQTNLRKQLIILMNNTLHNKLIHDTFPDINLVISSESIIANLKVISENTIFTEIPQLLGKILVPFNDNTIILENRLLSIDTQFSIFSKNNYKQQQILASKLATIKSSIIVEISTNKNTIITCKQYITHINEKLLMTTHNYNTSKDDIISKQLLLKKREQIKTDLDKKISSLMNSITQGDKNNTNNINVNELLKHKQIWTESDILNISDQERKYKHGIELSNLLNVSYNIEIISSEQNICLEKIKEITSILSIRKLYDSYITLQKQRDLAHKDISDHLINNNLTINMGTLEYLDTIVTEYNDAKRSQNILKCPHCSSYIRYVQSSLVKSDISPPSADYIVNREVLINSIRSLINKINILNALNNQLDNLKETLPMDIFTNKDIINDTNLRSKISDSKDTVISLSTKRDNMQKRYNILGNIIVVKQPIISSSICKLLVNLSQYMINRNTIIDYQFTEEELNKQLEIVEKNNIEINTRYSSDIMNKEKEIINAEKTINRLNKPIEEETKYINDSMITLKTLLSNEHSKVSKLKAIIDSERISLSGKIQTITSLIETLVQWNSYTGDLKNKLNIVISELEVLKSIKDEISNNLSEIVRISNEIPYSERIDLLRVEIPRILSILDGAKYYYRMYELQCRLEEKNKIINELLSDSVALTQLKAKAVDAECFQLQSTVDEINRLMNKILSDIFDKPITVTLQLFKQLKSKKGITKPTINLKVLYHGIEYDGISGLSGGEGDRISMALTLALNLVSPSPILILDESLSSLDGEMRTRCLNTLKRLCIEQGSLYNISTSKENINKYKYILCVNHEDIEGNYDRVTRIE